MDIIASEKGGLYGWSLKFRKISVHSVRTHNTSSLIEVLGHYRIASLLIEGCRTNGSNRKACGLDLRRTLLIGNQ